MKRPHQLAIASIRISKRHRRDLGDIDELAQSIQEIGLLQPIVVTPAGTLIAGGRRLKACKALGWDKVPITVTDIDKIARGEYAENHFRKAFTPSEYADIADELESYERAKAKARQRESEGRGKKGRGISPTLTGRALDKVARVIGKDRKTIQKARAVRDAAVADPERYGKLLDAMDKSGRVDGPYRRLKNMRQADDIRREPPPLPNKGPYRAAMVDCPWAYEPDDDDAADRAVLPYPTMSIEQLCAMDVASIMHEDSVLGFWVTNFILVRGLHQAVLRAWGFEPKTVVTWPKDRHSGRGHWAYGQTEHLVIAVRGKPIVTMPPQTTLMKGPFHLVSKGEHSTKPVEAYSYFESLCPASRYADLFSRYRHNDKWDCHGDEVPKKEAAE
jgi:N6-adenosine-specific RNA methylase IME4